MKKHAYFAAAILLAALAGYWTNPRRVFAQPVKLTPFAAEFVKTLYTATGARDPRPVTHFLYFRREDGSRYTRNWAGDDPNGLVTIVDAARFEYAILGEASRLKITFRYSPERFEGAMNPRQERRCPEVGGPVQLLESGGRRFGQSFMRLRVRNGSSTREELLAPALSCFSMESVETDGLGAKTVTAVTSLKVGPPPDSAFEVPEEYVERSPAALEQEYRARFGKEFWGDNMSQAMEKNYWKLRSLQDSPR